MNHETPMAQGPVECLVGRIAYPRNSYSKPYMVRGWYLDSNGCFKTYGSGYAESFPDETDYTPNVEVQRDSGSIIAGGSAGTTC